MFNVRIYLIRLIVLVCKTLINSQLKVIINGKENIPEEDSVLIVCNHCSYLDVFIISMAFHERLPNLDWVISKENYRNPLFKWLYPVFTVIVVNGTIAKVRLALKKRRWIVIFPEGARRWHHVDGKINKGKLSTGTAAIALSTGVAIVPVCITGTDIVLPPRSFKLNPQYGLMLTIGKPFRFEAVEQKNITAELLEEATEEIMNCIKELFYA